MTPPHQLGTAQSTTLPSIAIVGGGLAGLSAAVALSDLACRIELFEGRSWLGGRAASFRDPGTGEVIDQCQHVSMGCCTNLADFCQRTGIDRYFRRDRTLYFVGPDGRPIAFAADRWLPAPLHLARSFWRLKYLTVRERLAICLTMARLARTRYQPDREPSIGAWLRQQRQSPQAIERFWSVILVSALGEELDRASFSLARKVLIDGFFSNVDGYTVEVPQVPLGALYGESLQSWLSARNVRLHLGTPIRRVTHVGYPAITAADGTAQAFDFVVLALPWTKVVDVLPAEAAEAWNWTSRIKALPGSPITGVHLWFDRPIMDLPHAAIVERLSQWIFSRVSDDPAEQRQGHYYQVVISASRMLAGRDRTEVAQAVCRELGEIWPAARAATLLRSRVVTEQSAVFSALPGLDQVRPSQQTELPGVLIAGDWTATGWPATMESAVRSGYLAATAIARQIGQPKEFLVPDLPRGRLARLLIKSA